MELDIERKDMAQYGILAAVLFLLALYLFSLTLDTRVAASYSQFYLIQNILAFASIPVLVVFNWKLGEILEIPNIFKGVLIVVFTVFIVMISLPGVQQAMNYADCSGDVCVSRPIIKIPRAVAGNFQIDPSTETMTSAVVPAITEDLNYLFTLPLLLVVIMIFVGEAIGNVSGSQFIVFAIVACLIASTVFTGAHSPSYGNNQQAYTGAFIYSFGQSMTYVFTGWFVPAAHFLHNYIVNYSRSTSLSIGGSPFI